MSSKMSQKNHIRKDKDKKNLDKMDKAMKDVKRIGIVSCCIIGVFLIIGIFVNNNEKSYAAGFLTEVPDAFYSYVVNGDGNDVTVTNNLITGIGIPWEFSGYEAVDDGSGSYTMGDKISFIYCVDRQKNMDDNILYTKGDSVKNEITLDSQGITASYPGLIYIILNDNIVENYSLTIPSGQTEDTMNYYLAQVAIWYYIDTVNGTDYNFTADEKTTIDESSYGTIISDLVNGALNYQAYTTTDSYITIDDSSITYSLIGDYIETSLITPVGSNSYFESYSVQVNDSSSGIEILDADGNVVTGLIDANEGFKVRIPVSATQDNDFTLPITVSAYFSNNYDAYVYIPDNSAAQRALLGKVERVSTPTTFYLKAPTIDIPDTNSTSFLIYGLGAFIVIAGVVLIVVAKKPNNAKKK